MLGKSFPMFFFVFTFLCETGLSPAGAIDGYAGGPDLFAQAESSGQKRPKTKTQGIAQKEGIPEEQARKSKSKSKIKIEPTQTEDGSN